MKESLIALSQQTPKDQMGARWNAHVGNVGAINTDRVLYIVQVGSIPTHPSLREVAYGAHTEPLTRVREGQVRIL